MKQVANAPLPTSSAKTLPILTSGYSRGCKGPATERVARWRATSRNSGVQAAGCGAADSFTFPSPVCCASSSVAVGGAARLARSFLHSNTPPRIRADPRMDPATAPPTRFACLRSGFSSAASSDSLDSAFGVGDAEFMSEVVVSSLAAATFSPFGETVVGEGVALDSVAFALSFARN